MKKGEQTRAAIIAAAQDIAARDGLEGLTIGLLAERMQMSKSGVFAHFGSREELLIAVLKAYERHFADEVLVPSLSERRGLPRLRAMFRNWLAITAADSASGCIWISGAAEFDDRPGTVRDELVAMVRAWQRELTRALQQALEVGDLPGDADIDDLVFQLHGLVLVLHHDARLLKSPDALARAARAFERLIDSYRLNPARLAPSSA